jgi:succinate-semialdehyde dehydrogenase/glutarate-semialdehyde dehydrogenase
LNRRHGDGFDPATTLGPVNSRPALALLERQIADALRRGGRFAAGGGRIESGTGLHIAAGVMTGIDGGSLLNREESQGPIIPVFSFRSDGEFIELARAGPLGPSIAVFTRSMDAADDMARSVGADTVTVNEVRSCLDDGSPWPGTGSTIEASATLFLR